jgi:hypothetical protein
MGCHGQECPRLARFLEELAAPFEGRSRRRGYDAADALPDLAIAIAFLRLTRGMNQDQVAKVAG